MSGRPFDAVLMDLDGILTDGTVTIDAAGRESKRLSFEDIDAVFALKRAGLKIGFLSGEDTSFVDYVARRFEPDFLIRGCKDKLAALQAILTSNGLQPDRVCYIGDSTRDVPALGFLRHSFAPADADIEARRAAAHVVPALRGRGTVRQVARYVLGSVPGRSPLEGMLLALGEQLALAERVAAGESAHAIAEARAAVDRALRTGAALREETP